MGQGNGAIGGPMEPPPEGLWGMPAEMLKVLPGYGSDVARRRAEARQIMAIVMVSPVRKADQAGLRGRPGTYIYFGLSQRAAVLDHAFRDGANGRRA